MGQGHTGTAERLPGGLCYVNWIWPSLIQGLAYETGMRATRKIACLSQECPYLGAPPPFSDLGHSTVTVTHLASLRPAKHLPSSTSLLFLLLTTRILRPSLLLIVIVSEPPVLFEHEGHRSCIILARSPEWTAL